MRDHPEVSCEPSRTRRRCEAPHGADAGSLVPMTALQGPRIDSRRSAPTERRSSSAWLRGLCVATVLWGCAEDGTNSLDQTSDAGASSASAECHASSMPATLHEGDVTGLAIDGDTALFVDGALWRIPLAGGAPVKVADVDGARGLASAAGFAYVTGEHAVGAVVPKTESEPALYAVPLDGGDPVLVRDQFSLTYAVADTRSVYLADSGEGILVYTPPSMVATKLGIDIKLSVRALAENGSYLYVAAEDLTNLEKHNGVILRVAKKGGATKALITTEGLPDDIAVDDQGIYWIEEAPYGTFGDGHIARADLDGKHVDSLASVSASSLAMDDDYVYFLADSLSGVPETRRCGHHACKGAERPRLAPHIGRGRGLGRPLLESVIGPEAELVDGGLHPRPSALARQLVTLHDTVISESEVLLAAGVEVSKSFARARALTAACIEPGIWVTRRV